MASTRARSSAKSVPTARSLALEILEDRVLLSASAPAAFLQQPLTFEPNVGQTDSQVQFLARGQGYGLYLTPGEAVLNLYDKNTDAGTVLRAQFVGANRAAPAVGLEQQAGRTNYYLGNDPARWHTDVPLFGRVAYQDIYPGIDLVYYGTNQRQLEYDFVVAPGVDPQIIQVNFQGADSLALDDQGNLILHTAGGDVVQHAPVIYQDIAGRRTPVAGSFVLGAEQSVGFHVGAYDATVPLIIDPVVVFSTYHGGNGVDEALGIVATDHSPANGGIYVTGYTRSTNFPLSGSPSGASDAFVTKLNWAGTAIIWSTYLGGTGQEGGSALTNGYSFRLGANGVAVTGFTQSADFPMVSPLDSTLGGSQDAFVAFCRQSTGGLLFSSYLGGTGTETGTGIDEAPDGAMFVTGTTDSSDLPVVNALQPASGGGQDVFVAAFNNTIRFLTYLGGSGEDVSLGLGLDSGSNAFVTGRTQSSNFPTTAGLDTSLDGASDAFVAKLNPTGTSLLFATYLGGGGEENFDPAHAVGVGALAVDAADNVYVTGSTSSGNFPLLGPFDNSLGGTWDAFVTKLDASGTTVFSTYLGGGGNDFGLGIAVDLDRQAFVTGYTESADFPTFVPTQAALAGSRDAFVAIFDPLGIVPIFSTYLGGPGGTEGDIGRSIAVNFHGQALVAGSTDSTAFPTQSPRQPSSRGGVDAFLTRIAVTPGITLRWTTGTNGNVSRYTYKSGTFGTMTVTEGGPTDFYTVVLNSQPTADVIVTMNPDGQVSPSQATLTFTPANWSTEQTVTVTAVDDGVNELPFPASHPGSITHIASSADPIYNGMGVPDISANIGDNDLTGVYYDVNINNSANGFVVAEAGMTSDLFTVRLTSTPTANVVLTLVPDAQTTVSPTTVTFTSANWYAGQFVTVTAVDDALPEGSPHAGVISNTAGSGDPAYNGQSFASVTVNVFDDDNAVVLLNNIDGSIRVTEGGPTDIYTVVLGSPPSADVFITITGTQVTAAPNPLTFTAANWSTPQTVTVSAVDDLAVEPVYPGFHLGSISHTATSADAAYNGLAIGGFTLRINDNDTVGFYLSPAAVNVSEEGPTADSYVVVLTSTPAFNVFVTITADSQVATAPTVLTFTPANWFTVQTVNVTPLDDGTIEGAHVGVLTHTVTSADAMYNGFALTNVTANITDNDAIGVFFLETFASTDVSEIGATSDVYSLRLLSQPSANVAVTLNPGTQLSVSSAVVTFTPLTWNTPQTVTVTAVNDLIAETATHLGLVAHSGSSADPNYNGALASLSVNITDNDTSGITLTETAGTSAVAEGGGSDTYTLVLNSQPTANVVITLSPDAQLSVVPAALTFTALNWNLPQTVTASAFDDFMVETSPHQGMVAHVLASADPFYNGLSVPTLTANITDNDVGGVAVTQSGGTTNVTEGLGTDTYTVVLASLPTASVVITLAPGSQTTVSATRLTFAPANWNVQQTVTVTAVDDAVFEGPHTGVITHTPSSADPVYNGVAIGSVTANITDNDAVGILQSGGSTSVSESGGTDTYTLVLASMPTANVVITFNPGSQLAVSPAPLTFTPGSWNVAQTVTVSAINDMVAEGAHHGVIRHASISADANYQGVVIVDVTAQVADNDVAGVTVTASGGSTVVTEGIGSDLYDIFLNTQPTANVSITLSPDAGLVVAPTVLVFTPGNWNVPQIVTVTAPDDGIQQGPRTRAINHTVASGDPFYQPVVVASMAVNLLDPPGVTITATSGTNAVIEGAAQSYTVRLNTAPTAPVTIDLAGDSQVVVSPSQVVFSPTDWNVPRPLVVTAVDDGVVEGPHSGSLNFTVTSADPTYSSLAVSGFTAAVIDNDGTPVLGTSRADQIVVTFDATRILVTINNQVTTLPIALSQLVIQAGDGNDSIQVVSPTVPVVVVSGRGTDKVFATGQNGANSFVLDNGSVLVNGASVQVWETESLIVNGRGGADTFSVNGVPGYAVEFKGEAGTDQVIAGNRSNTWQITGPGGGSLNRTIKVTGVENWTGGPLGDSFVFAAGKSLGGLIDGGGGFDVLDYAAYTAAVSIHLGSSTATGTAGFANIARVVGGKSGADKLTGPDQILVWNITGSSAGTVGGVGFQSFENLTGGSLDDTFQFADGQSVRGKIDGGGGLDRLDYSAFTTRAVAINLQTRTATNTAGYLNVEQFTGGAMLDTLIGANLNSTWTLTGRGTGSIASSLAPIAFNDFEHLTGGSLIDTFSLTTALSDWLGTLNGGSGKDILTSFSGQPNLYVNTALNAGTLNGHKFVNVESRR